eukprot:4397386-Ditylum_brightwellii.AAC.1
MVEASHSIDAEAAQKALEIPFANDSVFLTLSAHETPGLGVLVVFSSLVLDVFVELVGVAGD